jgi:hypothetical protein
MPGYIKFNKNRFDLPLWSIVSVVVLFVLAVVGYVANVVKLFGIAQVSDPNYVMAVLRAAGILLAPLGAVLGFL